MEYNTVRFIDLFCGLGGIRIGFENALSKHNLNKKCVLSSDIKKQAAKTYKINFKEEVFGDIREINTSTLPSFDFLLAGFPCQAFSSAGKRMGFEDTRGTLFFEVARILSDKSPSAFILENVEGLIKHDNGDTLTTILKALSEVGYDTSWELLNSKNFGLAQSRNRIYIVGTRKNLNINTKEAFRPTTTFNKITFNDIRDFDLSIKDSKFNTLLKSHFKNLDLLGGKCIRDKRGGNNNLHSWDLGLKGEVSIKQKELMNLLATKTRYRQWAVQNGTAWFEGIPLSLEQIKSFVNYPEIKSDLDNLVNKGYLKMEHPKDYVNIEGKRTKVSRVDLPLGYRLFSGKLSFEFSKILNNNITPAIVATDASHLGVIEKDGIRQLSVTELKKLFGFPLDYKTDHLTKEVCFDLFGNSVAVNVIEHISDNLIKLLKY